MITFVNGNLFDTPCEAIVNTVNCIGVMGKGVALLCRNEFPENYQLYRTDCHDGKLAPGKLMVIRDTSLRTGEQKVIVNFPTKTDWRRPSRYTYVDSGLEALRKYLLEGHVKSIAIPPLGCGNGGLNWDIVRGRIDRALADLPVEIHIHEPQNR